MPAQNSITGSIVVRFGQIPSLRDRLQGPRSGSHRTLPVQHHRTRQRAGRRSGLHRHNGWGRHWPKHVYSSEALVSTSGAASNTAPISAIANLAKGLRYEVGVLMRYKLVFAALAVIPLLLFAHSVNPPVKRTGTVDGGSNCSSCHLEKGGTNADRSAASSCRISYLINPESHRHSESPSLIRLRAVGDSNLLRDL